MKINTVKDICERIFLLEAEHGLLDLGIDGVKIWQYMRMQIYYRIAQTLGVISDPHPSSLNLIQKTHKIIARIKHAFLKNPFHNLSRVEYVIVPHTRSKKIDGKLTDIYTEDIISRLESKKKKFICFEFPFQGFHRRTPTGNMRYMDYLSVVHWWRKHVSKYKFSHKTLIQLEHMESLVDNTFKITTGLREDLIDGLRRFHINYEIYTHLLQRLSPTAIFLVTGYAHGDLIKAARDLHIETIELQHGTIGRYHLGYIFPDRRLPLDYFPDRVVVWGRYWKKSIAWPIGEKNIELNCYKHFHELRRSYGDIEKNPNSLVVLSQGAISGSLAKKMLSFARELNEYHIYYKLHPSEYEAWKRNEDLIKLSKLDNVDIIETGMDLYELLAESTYQLGVFSTAIYEGIGMGCKTLLLNLPGIENMTHLIENGMAIVHKDSDDIKISLRKLSTISSERLREEVFGVDNESA